MTLNTRWVFARVTGLGDVYMLTEGSVSAASFKVKRITAALSKKDERGGFHVELSRHPLYAMGLMADPVTVEKGAVLFTCPVPPKAADACASVWSDVVRGTVADLRRLDGRNGE